MSEYSYEESKASSPVTGTLIEYCVPREEIVRTFSVSYYEYS